MNIKILTLTIAILSGLSMTETMAADSTTSLSLPFIVPNPYYSSAAVTRYSTLPTSKVTNAPTTTAQYGITDTVTTGPCYSYSTGYQPLAYWSWSFGPDLLSSLNCPSPNYFVTHVESDFGYTTSWGQAINGFWFQTMITCCQISVTTPPITINKDETIVNTINSGGWYPVP